ncbi:MAG: hypothetical protein ABSF46_30095 [Terriglobia bacterium]|jgi:hypothetical protein
MGGFQFDRKSYIPGEAPPRPAHVQDRLTYVLAILAILGAGYAAYKILGSGPAPDMSVDAAELARTTAKLNEIERRLDVMEERLNARKPAAPAVAVKAEPAKTAAPAASAPLLRVRNSPPPQPQAAPPAAPQPAPDVNALREEGERAISSIRSDVAATQQEWAATADRLGNVVGELNSQHQEIERNQEGLAQLEVHFERDSVPFTVRKDGTRQQVGPVRLLLESTDIKNSRYTMRLFFQDKWIELKDRALHEAIQFYEPSGEVALELMVDRIAKEAVAGRIALPPQTNASR